MSFVLQPWVGEVGLKMQSILLSGLRAPDVKTTAVKKCIRWLRARCQIDADPTKQSYMQGVQMSNVLIEDAVDECEYLTCHFVHHLADSFAVAAYHHPDEIVRQWCITLHNLIATEIWHFHPETCAEFTERHQDKI